MRDLNGVAFQRSSNNSKLVRVETLPETGSRPGNFRHRFKAVGARCSSTYVSISATCPRGCPYLDAGCYAQHGLTRMVVRRLDAEAREAGLDADDVSYREAKAVAEAFKKVPQDGRRGGRDLRLHVSGDVATSLGAKMLDLAAGEWGRRGGGAVWTYTHAWRTVPREAFGRVSTLASVENPEDAFRARALGYAPAIVVDRFPTKSYFNVSLGLGIPNPIRFIACPAETRGTPCVECRLCLDDGKLRRAGVGIAFEAHGAGRSKVVQEVTQLKFKKEAVP